MSIFSRVRKSERVHSICCICKSKIEYLYKPTNQEEHILLFRYCDIEIVNICQKCGALRHFLCSSKRKDKIQSETPNISSGPTYFEALKGAVEGGEQENDTYLDVLEKETKGLECPLCGSFQTLTAFMKKDGDIIKVKSGKRTDLSK